MSPPSQSDSAPDQKSLSDLIFVGFNSRVVALDRYSGEIVWDWKSPEGTGYVSLLLDGDRLIASINGYTYCLDPVFGQQVWANPLKGLGVGVASVTSVNGRTDTTGIAEKARQAQAAAASGGGAGVV